MKTQPIYNSETGRVYGKRRRRRLGEMSETLKNELKNIKEYSKQEHASIRIAASMVVLAALGQ